MSAMFERESGTHFRDLDIARTLELRYTPYVTEVFAPYASAKNRTYFENIQGLLTTTKSDQWIDDLLESLIPESTANWMYSAVNQHSMNGSEPLWTRDGWNFIPLDVVEAERKIRGSNKYTEAISALYSSTNLTFDTPALRGRVECSPIPDFNDPNSWIYVTDDSLSNVTSGKTSCPVVYRGSEFVTNIMSEYGYLGCYVEDTEQLERMPQQQFQNFSGGYWSKNYYRPTSDTAEDPTGNFTVKWVHGAAGSLTTTDRYGDVTHTYFPEVPKLQALNCMPIIERGNARVTIDPKVGQVLSYDIRGEPQLEEAAWVYSFVLRNLTDPSKERRSAAMGEIQNQTTR